MLVLTFLLYGGLNQMIFLFRCFLLLAVSIFALYLSLCLYPDLSKASWYGIAELLKISSEEDNDESQDSMESRSCLIIDGGWKKLKNLFAEKLVNIANKDKVIIKHARKSLLYNNSEPWMKKDSRLFDVMMGAYDGAEYASW